MQIADVLRLGSLSLKPSCPAPQTRDVRSDAKRLGVRFLVMRVDFGAGTSAPSGSDSVIAASDCASSLAARQRVLRVERAAGVGVSVTKETATTAGSVGAGVSVAAQSAMGVEPLLRPSTGTG